MHVLNLSNKRWKNIPEKSFGGLESVLHQFFLINLKNAFTKIKRSFGIFEYDFTLA